MMRTNSIHARQLKLARQLVGISAMTLAVSAVGCDEPAESLEDPRFSSPVATLMDFEFEGRFITTSSSGLQRRAEDQVIYSVGQLNGNNSVGRLDKLRISDVEAVSLGGGQYEVTYHAVLPVAWGSKNNLPTSYDFILPKHISSAGLQAFADAYSTTCVDRSAHDVTSGSMWYYYRPSRSGCTLAEDDVVSFPATISRSEENTSGKYPEYDKVWEDDVLDVVAIFGKYEDGATANSDAGISAYNRFSQQVRSLLGSTDLVSVPESLPNSPGVDIPEISFDKTLADGRRVRVTMLLVDNVRTAGAAFDNRYNELSAVADMIFYNGHAGLGSNTRALARKGTVLPGKYQIFFMNGCDTFAYVDTALTDKKISVNPDDPNGTKYLDMVTNAMPSYFSHMSGATVALIRGLTDLDSPRTYDSIFSDVARVQVVLVTGEEDNAFDPDADPDWEGMEVTGTAAWREMQLHATPELPAGTYTFTLAPNPADERGDADLYVRKDLAPTRSEYDCRSVGNTTEEVCEVVLDQASVLHVGVYGYYRRGSGFILEGSAN